MASVGGFSKAIYEAHGILATLARCPELALETDEAKDLAEAIRELEKHYNIPVVNPKHMAILTLLGVAGRVYVPRAMAIAARKAGGGDTPTMTGAAQTVVERARAASASDVAQTGTPPAPEPPGWFGNA